MPKDYKYRANQSDNKASGISWWKWLLVIILVGLFAGFLYHLRSSAPVDEEAASQAVAVSIKKPAVKTVAKKKAQEPEKPRYDFYTLLPEKDVVVPDYEIKTQVREERVGKAKSTQYIVQAGSFRNFTDANDRKIKLAMMGIESRVEKAKVGDVEWNRVRLGPFIRPSSVYGLKKRLKDNGIDVVVMEYKQ